MEFCWIWESKCDGDQYAAWVAAIGTILALIVAIALAYSQVSLENKRRENETKRKYRKQIQEIIFFGQAMYELVSELNQKLQPGGTYEKPRYTETSSDLLNDIRQLATDELNEQQKALYLTLRKKFSGIFAHIHHGDAGVYASEYAKDISDITQKFRAYLS